MSNPNDIIKDLSDQELCDAVEEILKWHDTGVLKKGMTRSCAQKINNVFGIPIPTSLVFAEKNILSVAATRFVASVKKGA